MIDQSE